MGAWGRIASLTSTEPPDLLLSQLGARYRSTPATPKLNVVEALVPVFLMTGGNRQITQIGKRIARC